MLLFFRISSINFEEICREQKFKTCDDSPIFLRYHRPFLCLNRQRGTLYCQFEPCYCKSFVNWKHSVNEPDPCENWMSTPGPKRITGDKIKIPIMYAYCLYVYSPNQNCWLWMFLLELQILMSKYPLLCVNSRDSSMLSFKIIRLLVLNYYENMPM